MSNPLDVDTHRIDDQQMIINADRIAYVGPAGSYPSEVGGGNIVLTSVPFLASAKSTSIPKART